MAAAAAIVVSWVRTYLWDDFRYRSRYESYQKYHKISRHHHGSAPVASSISKTVGPASCRRRSSDRRTDLPTLRRNMA